MSLNLVIKGHRRQHQVAPQCGGPARGSRVGTGEPPGSVQGWGPEAGEFWACQIRSFAAIRSWPRSGASLVTSPRIVWICSECDEILLEEIVVPICTDHQPSSPCCFHSIGRGMDGRSYESVVALRSKKISWPPIGHALLKSPLRWAVEFQTRSRGQSRCTTSARSRQRH